jgi:hypothetical protein
MILTHNTYPAEIRECMGPDTTDVHSRRMLDILLQDGWSGWAISEIPEDAWNAMLERACERNY